MQTKIMYPLQYLVKKGDIQKPRTNTFLEFVKVIERLTNINDPHDIKIDWGNINVHIMEQIRNHMGSDLISLEKK